MLTSVKSDPVHNAGPPSVVEVAELTRGQLLVGVVSDSGQVVGSHVRGTPDVPGEDLGAICVEEEKLP